MELSSHESAIHSKTCLAAAKQKPLLLLTIKMLLREIQK